MSLGSVMHGLSWTLDREKAQWSANRWLCVKRRRPILLQTVARKRDVVAYFAGRNEQKIVVHLNIARKLAITIL
jgi:hypothetical protein